MPTGIRRRTPAKKPPVTLKLVALSWHPPDEDWRTETLQITGYNTIGGALTLFLDKKILRSHAPGFWGDLLVIGEEPMTAASTSSDTTANQEE